LRRLAPHEPHLGGEGLRVMDGARPVLIRGDDPRDHIKG
jgi:hypothetical protein